MSSGEHEGVGPEGVGPELADVVARLRRAMRRSARAADPGAGLSVAQLELLSCVAHNPSVRPGQVGRLLRLAPSSVTTLVNGLVSARLVTRSAGPGDRRTSTLRLTASGSAAVHRWQAVNEDLVRGALHALPPGSLVALRDAVPALREFAEAIDALAGEPGHALPHEPGLASPVDPRPDYLRAGIQQSRI